MVLRSISKTNGIQTATARNKIVNYPWLFWKEVKEAENPDVFLFVANTALRIPSLEGKSQDCW